MAAADDVSILKERFLNAIHNVTTFRQQTTVEVGKGRLKEILAFLKRKEGLGYLTLMDLTAVDYLYPAKRTKLIYFLHNPNNLQKLRLTIYAGRGERMPSVSDLWAGADWYERELYDLYGIHFDGHPDLKRILMPDDWQGHPLLKDYALTEESVEFKHGVKPKVPSEIIPYVQNFSRT